jgi:hypothetical protein
MATAERELRAAQNQLLFRSVNERIAELGERSLGSASAEVDFACECDNETCVSPISLKIEDFAAIDRRQNRFIVCRDHEDVEVEDVVEARDGYVIVAKRGAGAEFIKGFQDTRS